MDITTIGNLNKNELSQLRQFANKNSNINTLYIRDLFQNRYTIFRTFENSDPEDPGSLTGFAIGHDDNKASFYLSLICTVPGYGHGTKLMSLVHEHCTNNLFIEINLDSFRNVVPFYKKNGYTKIYKDDDEELTKLTKFTDFDQMLDMLGQH
jgi:hypothetical protein